MLPLLLLCLSLVNAQFALLGLNHNYDIVADAYGVCVDNTTYCYDEYENIYYQNSVEHVLFQVIDNCDLPRYDSTLDIFKSVSLLDHHMRVFHRHHCKNLYECMQKGCDIWDGKHSLVIDRHSYTDLPELSYFKVVGLNKDYDVLTGLMIDCNETTISCYFAYLYTLSFFGNKVSAVELLPNFPDNEVASRDCFVPEKEYIKSFNTYVYGLAFGLHHQEIVTQKYPCFEMYDCLKIGCHLYNTLNNVASIAIDAP